MSRILPFRVTPVRDRTADFARSVEAAMGNIHSNLRQQRALDWQRERMDEENARADARAAEAKAEKDAAKAQAIMLGTAMAGGDYGAGARAALSSGDIRTGVDLMKLDEGRRERAAARTATADAAAARKRDADAKVAANTILDLDPQDPQFGQKYAETLGGLRKMGLQVPVHYDDPVLGYRLARSEIMDWKQRAAHDEALAVKRGGPGPASETTPLGVDAEGNVVGGSRRSEVLSSGATATYRPSTSSTGGVNFGQAGVGSEEVPGVVVDRSGNGGTRANAFATRKAEGQTAIAEATPEDQQRMSTIMRNNRAWTEVYGKPPPAGSVYNEKGDVVDLKKRGEDRGGTQAQKAARGAIEWGIESLDTAREAITGLGADGKRTNSGTNVVTRSASYLAGSGTYDRASKLLRPAVRSIMHGISGAQVNIPETKDYFDTFMPSPIDSADTINFKLNHLKGMSLKIRDAINSGAGDNTAAIEAIRKQMREALALPVAKKDGANPVRDQLKAKYGLQ